MALYEVFPGEEHRRHLFLLDQAPEALWVDAEDACGLHQVQIIVKRLYRHITLQVRR
jgi:hypothetical protein